MAGSFAHLHTHTEYSMLDGAARVDDVTAAAARDGQPAIAITDHGNMYGVLDFYKAARRHGINPVIGLEAYQAHDSRYDRPVRRSVSCDDGGGEAGGGQKLYYHLTLLAENNSGYRNLIQLSSRAFLDGYWYKPRCDWELLERYSRGLIATTGCLGGHVLQHLLRGDRAGALAAATRLQDIFGRDNLFVELQDHGIADQARTNPQLLDIAKRIGAPVVATNDCHYTAAGDSAAHDALLCVQTGAKIADEKRFRFHGHEHYLKSAAQMRELFVEVPEACDSTLWIAERCNVEIGFGKAKLPQFPLPEGFDDGATYLRQLTFAGATERWGSPLPADAVDRLNFELQVITDMGFADYFLIVEDLVAHAREAGIRVGPGRGSAAGCAVAYSLRITDLDPIKYDLLFERFLNPARVSMPDIDMDFDSRYRDEMIRYAAERYGRDRVAQIVTFSTIKARAAVRDAARVLDKPYALGDRIAKAMPAAVAGRDTPLWAALAATPPERYAEGWRMASELRAMVEGDAHANEVVSVARGLEGLRRQDGIHAAAVVITREPLTDYLPIQRKPEAGVDIDDAPIVTQYEMHGVEDLGLLKMDFLGLRNLDVIDMTVKLIEEVRGVTVDIDHVPLDDPGTFELLRRADTTAVFQLEGTQMRDLMRRLAPTSFEDVAALVALYRPGPMAANMHLDFADRKNGRKPVEMLHPDLEDVLGDTYQLMIYQEQMMRVAQRLAGYSLAEADLLRKAAGKKSRKIMATERAKFVAGCETQGYATSLGHRVFDIIEPFADYAFNKSHAFGYGLISYQTAYLKANWPAEYMSCVLSSVQDKQERSAVFLADCRAMGIDVNVPDVNTGRALCTVAVDRSGEQPGSIVFGLSGIRNVGTAVAEAIVQERETAGPYASFHDFCARVDPTALNKRAVESLIRAGGFDTLAEPRKGLLAVHQAIIDQAISRRRDADAGVMSLFASAGDTTPAFEERIDVPAGEFDKKTLLAAEKELLGLYLSDHPLAEWAPLLAREPSVPVSEFGERSDTDVIVWAGLVATLETRHTKKGALMAVGQIEDLTGAAELVVFPRTLEQYSELLVEGAVVRVTGRLDTDHEAPKLLASTVEALEGVDSASPFLIDAVGFEEWGEAGVAALQDVLRRYPGRRPVVLHAAGRSLRLPDPWSVAVSDALNAELAVLIHG